MFLTLNDDRFVREIRKMRKKVISTCKVCGGKGGWIEPEDPEDYVDDLYETAKRCECERIAFRNSYRMRRGFPWTYDPKQFQKALRALKSDEAKETLLKLHDDPGWLVDNGFSVALVGRDRVHLENLVLGLMESAIKVRLSYAVISVGRLAKELGYGGLREISIDANERLQDAFDAEILAIMDANILSDDSFGMRDLHNFVRTRITERMSNVYVVHGEREIAEPVFEIFGHGSDLKFIECEFAKGKSSTWA